jgi:hypothetical protein
MMHVMQSARLLGAILETQDDEVLTCVDPLYPIS